eukprot:6461521-Amphidinium_carterae.1
MHLEIHQLDVDQYARLDDRRFFCLGFVTSDGLALVALYFYWLFEHHRTAGLCSRNRKKRRNRKTSESPFRPRRYPKTIRNKVNKRRNKNHSTLPSPHTSTNSWSSPYHRLAKADDEHFIMTHLAYADDLIFPCFAEDPSQLLRTTVELLRQLQEAFRIFTLLINWSRASQSCRYG